MILLSLSIILHASISDVRGEFLQMVPTEIDFSRVIKNITGGTITSCYMQCSKEEKCDSFGITENLDGHLNICHLMEKSSNSKEGKGEKTIQMGTGLVTKPSPVNGGFSAWKIPTSCSATCGEGNVTISRSCDNPTPQHGGADCCGERMRTQPCFLRHCPVNGGFAAWSGPTSCSSTCGVGHVTYSRSCDNPAPQHGGGDCVGEKTKTKPCLLKYCEVCYASKDNNYATFTVWKTGSLKAIRLTHISGSLTCAGGHSAAKWGCSWHGNTAFTVVITDERNQLLFPESVGYYHHYKIEGANIDDDEITLSKSGTVYVQDGQSLRIWDYEDLKDHSEYDNEGKHCVSIELIYDE